MLLSSSKQKRDTSNCVSFVVYKTIITKNYVIMFLCLFFLFLYLWHFVFVEYFVAGEGEGKEDRDER